MMIVKKKKIAIAKCRSAGDALCNRIDLSRNNIYFQNSSRISNNFSAPLRVSGASSFESRTCVQSIAAHACKSLPFSGDRDAAE